VGLDRFLAAQDRRDTGYVAALAEIRSGVKTGHWIWYVFPQLYGLGMSSQSRAYGIRGVAEATDYLHDSELRARMIEIASAVAEQLRQGTPLSILMGSSIDVLKLVSSLTLFGGVARRLACDEPSGEFEMLATIAEEILLKAQADGYPPCDRTLAELGGESPLRT
jgi:uncharacterized protein (DUF1810 family)